MRFKRLAAAVLSLALTAALSVTAYSDNSTTATVPVTLSVSNQYRAVNVTVPASLPVEVINGVVVTAENACIVNNAPAGSVQVTNISVENGAYTVGNYDSFTGSKTIALKINGCATTGSGKLNITREAFPPIAAGGQQKLTYYAKVSADTAPVNNVQAASVVFTIAILISALIAVSVISGTVVPAGAEDSDDECNHIHTSIQWDDIYWQELCLDCGAQTGTGVRLGGPPEDEESNPGTQESNDTAVSDENQDNAGNEANEAPEAPVLTNEVCYFCEDQISAYQAGGSSAYMVFDVMDNLRHRVCVTCPDCGDYRTFDEEHRFLTAKSAEQYNSEQHRTSKTCSACGYGLFEYADHDWKFGSWESIGNGMCVRTKECSICGLSRSETETFDTEETTVSSGQGSMNTDGGQRGGNDCPEVQPDSGGASALPGTQPVETPLPFYPVTGYVQPGTSHVGDNRPDNSDTMPVNQTEAGNTWSRSSCLCMLRSRARSIPPTARKS